jgi:hypothetical protein
LPLTFTVELCDLEFSPDFGTSAMNLQMNLNNHGEFLLFAAASWALSSLADHFTDSDSGEGEFYPPFPLLYAIT